MDIFKKFVQEIVEIRIMRGGLGQCGTGVAVVYLWAYHHGHFQKIRARNCGDPNHAWGVGPMWDWRGCGLFVGLSSWTFSKNSCKKLWRSESCVGGWANVGLAWLWSICGLIIMDIFKKFVQEIVEIRIMR